MNNYMYYGDVNEHSDNEQLLNELDYKCVICFENILNIEENFLNKICVCVDSLVCNKCLVYMADNNIKKCPICRTNLNFDIIKKYIFNLKNIITYYLNFLLFILCNTIIYNVVLNYKYYYNSSTYPNLNDDNNNDYKFNYNNYDDDNDRNNNVINYYDMIKFSSDAHDFVINNNDELDIRKSYFNYQVCKNSVFFRKEIYFIFTNLLINILFPVMLGINNMIGIYKNYNEGETFKMNSVLIYILTSINMIIISIICFIKPKIEYLKLLLILNTLLYGILFFGFISIYFYVYINLLHKKYRNNNIIERINYNIVREIYLNMIQTTDV